MRALRINNLDKIYMDFHAERVRAHLKHKDRSMEVREWNDPLWLAILGEEFGEVARAICEGVVWYSPEYKNDDVESQNALRTELVQLGAMCTAWIVALDDAS